MRVAKAGWGRLQRCSGFLQRGYGTVANKPALPARHPNTAGTLHPCSQGMVDVMITTLIGSRSICSWRTTVHHITPQRMSVSSLLCLAWEVKRLTQNHPAIYRRVSKSTFYLVELHSISTHCPGLPTGPQSVFHTVISLCSSSASSKLSCGTQDTSAGVCLLLLSFGCMAQGFESKVEIIDQTTTASGGPHSPITGLPSYIPVSQIIVHATFNRKSPSFSYNSLPRLIPSCLRKRIVSKMIFISWYWISYAHILPQKTAMLSIFLTFGEFKARPSPAATLKAF